MIISTGKKWFTIHMCSKAALRPSVFSPELL